MWVAALFAWFVYDQMNEMDQIRRQSIFIAKAHQSQDLQSLLAMEEFVFNEIQAGKWQVYYKSQYLNILWGLKKYQKIIDLFDKERASIIV